MKAIFIDITKYFIGVSSILYIIASILLWKWSSLYFKLANRILAFFFAVIAYNSFTYLLITTGYIKHVPFLYKVAFPFNYLPYPLAYLYITTIIYSRHYIRLKDILHLVPFVLTFVDYLPFYFMPLDQKSIIIDRLLSSGMESFLVDGSIIPIEVHFLARFVLGLFYCSMMVRFLIAYNKRQLNIDFNNQFFEHDNEVIKWLKKLVFWMAFLFISYSLSVFLMEIDVDHNKKITYIGIGLIFSSVAILFLVIHIFLHPRVLYGVSILNEVEKELSVEDPTAVKLRSKKEQDFDWVNFEKTLKADKPFRMAGISLNEVSIMYSISPRSLSFLINNYKNQSFQNYFNELRIEYVISLINEGKHLEQTIEAIGSEAGFGSKSAFFSTFKKLKGCTPKEYILKSSVINDTL